jgi:tetratricopeptide (TPR) repeat protein
MKTVNQIDKFLIGRLSENERKSFENELINNESLRQQVEFQKNVNKVIMDDEYHTFNNVVRKVLDNNKQNSKHKLLKAGYKYAVAACVVLLVGIMFITKQKTTNQVYEKFYMPYETSSVTRSSVVNNYGELDLALLHYQKGDYQDAFVCFDNYLKKNQDSNFARFYLGLCYMENNKYHEAESLFAKIVLNENSPYVIHSQWYLALSLLKNNKAFDAESILKELSKSNNFYQLNAQKLLDYAF